jgi:hypothetical protein
LRKLLLVIFAVLVGVRLYDYVFHGGNGHDLAGAVGFSVLALGTVLDERARRAAGNDRSARRVATIVAAVGVVVVLVSFMLRWQVFG